MNPITNGWNETHTTVSEKMEMHTLGDANKRKGIGRKCRGNIPLLHQRASDAKV